MSTRSAKPNNRRPDIEQLLDQNGIKWEYAEVVPIDQIERHIGAQSRLGDVDEDRVKRFAEQKKNGAIFPPPVLWANGFENYGVNDGNTRIAADRMLHRTETSAYIIEVSGEAEAVFVSALFNATNGQELTKEEVRRAVILAAEMDSPPTNERMARLFGVNPATITKIQNVFRVSGELSALGIDPDQFNEASLQKLAKLNDVAVQRGLAQLVVDAKPSQSEIRDLVKDILTKKSEAERLAVVSDARAARQDRIQAVTTGRSVGASPHREAAMAFGRLVSLFDAYPRPQDWVPADATRRAEQAERLRRVVAFLGQVEQAFNASATT